MVRNKKLIREFIRSGVSPDEKLRVMGNLAWSDGGGTILRYRSGNQCVVVTDIAHAIHGDFRNVEVHPSAMKLLRQAYEISRRELIDGWASFAPVTERLDRMLQWHGADKMLNEPNTSEGIRIMRARTGIYAHRYVVYDDHGYSCFAVLEDAATDMLKRDNPGVGLFDSDPHRTGIFTLT